jgi:hypothetical protein
VKRGGINYISNKYCLEVMGHTQLLVPLELIKINSSLAKKINFMLKNNATKREKFKDALIEILKI